MKLRLAAVAMAFAFLGAFILAPVSTEAAPPANQGSATLAGTGTAVATGALTSVTGTVTSLVATLDRATGLTTITGAFTDTAGNVTNFTTTLLGASGACQILDLTLGPLDLNVLGVVVHLDTVHLNITAQSGSGNLLGNLLCSVAHLLDSNASGQALTNLLNRIFSLLG
jgi:hypothetical protein